MNLSQAQNRNALLHSQTENFHYNLNSSCQATILPQKIFGFEN